LRIVKMQLSELLERREVHGLATPKAVVSQSPGLLVLKLPRENIPTIIVWPLSPARDAGDEILDFGGEGWGGLMKTSAANSSGFCCAFSERRGIGWEAIGSEPRSGATPIARGGSPWIQKQREPFRSPGGAALRKTRVATRNNFP
jgi:hypothetical protein